jgi:hypothetical protein
MKHVRSFSVAVNICSLIENKKEAALSTAVA